MSLQAFLSFSFVTHVFLLPQGCSSHIGYFHSDDAELYISTSVNQSPTLSQEHPP